MPLIRDMAYRELDGYLDHADLVSNEQIENALLDLRALDQGELGARPLPALDPRQKSAREGVADIMS